MAAKKTAPAKQTKPAKAVKAPKARETNPHPYGTAAWVAWRDFPFTRKGAAAPGA